ncbi:hypothetical protein Pst134EB_008149 [Puccinia striiformis f. sp. tritici]|nr:hypothetical protein Pst134EB_008149 [Puccinia striiformis f. sp. tritici]
MAASHDLASALRPALSRPFQRVTFAAKSPDDDSTSQIIWTRQYHRPSPIHAPSYARSPHNVLRERHRNSDRMAGPLPRTIAVGIEYNVYLQDDDQLENQDPHLFTNPKGCSINLNTAVDFQGFKKAVIDQIGQADKRLQDMLTTDVASDNPQSSWGLQIQNNEAALFRGSIHMPIADDSMYKQWNWGIRVTQNGRPIVSHTIIPEALFLQMTIY